MLKWHNRLSRIQPLAQLSLNKYHYYYYYCLLMFKWHNRLSRMQPLAQLSLNNFSIIIVVC